jgi:hypothetical protein
VAQDKGVVVVDGNEGELAAGGRAHPADDEARARRRGERPTQTARSLGARTVCSCPSVSLGNTSALTEA